MRYQKGFTFIELILYVSIITIMLTAIVPFGWKTIINSTKSTVQQELYSQGRFVSEKIKYEIRKASGISSVSSNSIFLTNFFPDTSTVIDFQNGKARISKNGAVFVDLNSDNTNITNLIFTNYTSSDQKTKNIGFIFTISSNFPNVRQEYKDTITLKGNAEVRSN